MKRLVLSRSVLLIGLFVVGQSFVPTADSAFNAASMAEELSIMETVAGATASKEGGVKDVNVTGPSRSIEGISDVNVTGADANTAVEPNEEDPHVKMLKDIEKAFEDVKQSGQKEGREWLRFKDKERISLARAIQGQVLDELNVLREIAVEEDAVKTTAAIDMLIADRQERYEKVLTRIETEDEKMRRREEMRSKRVREREDRRQRRID